MGNRLKIRNIDRFQNSGIDSLNQKNYLIKFKLVQLSYLNTSERDLISMILKHNFSFWS